MGTLKTTNIQSISGSGTVTLGTSGETFTVPSGVTVNMSSATQTGVGGANTPAFFARKGSNQTVSNATHTLITYDVEDLDSDGKFASNKFTPTVAGWYQIGCRFRFDSATDSAYSQISIRKNGTDIGKHVEGQFEVLTKQIYSLIYLDTDDYVEVYAYQYTGGNVTVNGNSSLDSVAAIFYGYKIIT